MTSLLSVSLCSWMVRLGLRENVTLLRFGISGISDALVSQLKLELQLLSDVALLNLFHRRLIADKSQVSCLNSELVSITETCLEIVGLSG